MDQFLYCSKSKTQVTNLMLRAHQYSFIIYFDVSASQTFIIAHEDKVHELT